MGESRIIPEPQGLREDRMIREERWADIHQARAVEHWSVSRIAREFDLDRKTVRECLRQPAWKPYTRQAPVETLLTTYTEFLKARAPEVRYSARILFQELQKQHQYAGGSDTVRRFVQPLRTALEIAEHATMRFETAPGDLAAQRSARAWRRVSGQNGSLALWRAGLWASRLTPAHGWWTRGAAPQIRLLCQRDFRARPETEYDFVRLRTAASLTAIVQLARQQWAIEQQYAELKDEFGLRHFEGRSFHRRHRHVVVVAPAYAFLQRERQRRRSNGLTGARAQGVMTEILAARCFLTQRRHVNALVKLAGMPVGSS